MELSAHLYGIAPVLLVGHSGSCPSSGRIGVAARTLGVLNRLTALNNKNGIINMMKCWYRYNSASVSYAYECRHYYFAASD